MNHNKHTLRFMNLHFHSFPDDLSEMHRINEESYRNPVSSNSGQIQGLLMRDERTSGVEARAPLSHRPSGSDCVKAVANKH